jgi:peptidoglycan/LPS O-acetylase OafA/YrhL
MRYRAEVDGLRAIAVLPVILFHAGITFFHGGFIGVDIFFVISGYLITSLIAEEREHGKFSISNFYERRARRILPALFFVLLCCLPVAWWVMNSSDFINFSQSLAAVSVFSSGLLFIFTAGYFDASSDLKPLLHTWSLGVEEQFYLFFPPIFMWLARQGALTLRLGMLAMAVASLLFANWGSVNLPTSTFYFMPTRAWELLIGAILAVYQPRLSALPLAVSQAGSALGMGLILLAAAIYDRHTPFPGYPALLPTVGTAMVIGFGHAGTWVGRLLSTKPLVSIGLISYSAYLWHQPLFAYTRIIHGDEPPIQLMLAMALLSLVLAYATWRWIETPMRSRQLMNRQQVFALSGAFTTGFIAIGMAGHFHLLPTRWEQQNPHLVNYTPVASEPERSNCSDVIKGGGGYGTCVQIGEGKHTMVVWGDSHAKALINGKPNLPDTRILVISHSGCPPLPGVRRFDKSEGARACADFEVLQNYGRIIEKLRPDTVVLASRWMMYLRGWVFEGRKMHQHFMVSDGQDELVLASMAYRETMLREHLQKVIDRLTPHSRVLILTQPMDLAQMTFRDVEFGNLTVSRAEVDAWHAPEQAVFNQLKLPANAHVVDLKNLFCTAQGCSTRQGGTLLYRDDNHLSTLGATEVWEALGGYTAKLAKAEQAGRTGTH